MATSTPSSSTAASEPTAPGSSTPTSPPPPAKAAKAEADSPVKAEAPTASVPSATAASEEKVDIGEPATGEVVDMDVFGQLLEIDDDDTHDFSKSLAFDYISQAETTFTQIDTALASRDLDDLSRRGHFLKGSSAALGLRRVQRSCELMQHFGHRKDEHGEGPEMSEELALKKCTALLVRLRNEQDEAKEWLERFYKA